MLVRLIASGGSEGKSDPCLSPSSWVCWQSCVPWQSPSLHCHKVFFVCVCVCVCVFVFLCPKLPLLIRMSVFGLTPVLVQYDLILTSLHLQRSYFQKDYILRFLVDMNWEGALFNPVQYNRNKIHRCRDFPGGPLAHWLRLRSHCKGSGSILGQGTRSRLLRLRVGMP